MKAGVSKEELVKSLEFTLKLTREKIDSLELIYDETVVIHYESGYGQKVNIACNSAMEIIRDVAKAID